MSKSKAAALRALEIDGELAEAHAALGWVKWVLDWDRSGSEQAFKRAIRLSAACVSAHHSYGFLLISTGRFDDAIAEIQAALDLDPFSLPTHSILIWALICARRFEEAIQQGLRTIELDPSYPASHCMLALAYALNGWPEKAVESAEACSRLSDGDVLMLTGSAYAYAAAGKKRKAQDILSELTEKPQRGHVPGAMVAPVCAALGLKNESLSWLERACEERCAWLPWVSVDPRLDPLRGDERFSRMLKKLKLKPVQSGVSQQHAK